MERHLQTVIASLAIILLTWVGYSVVELKGVVSGNGVRIESLRDQVRTLSDDTYRSSQAVADFRLRDEHINANTAANTANSSRLDRLERDSSRK